MFCARALTRVCASRCYSFDNSIAFFEGYGSEMEHNEPDVEVTTPEVQNNIPDIKSSELDEILSLDTVGSELRVDGKKELDRKQQKEVFFRRSLFC